MYLTEYELEILPLRLLSIVFIAICISGQHFEHILAPLINENKLSKQHP